jgi:tRNA-2-methylthio-N6-dimethylallyladenosine synthase
MQDSIPEEVKVERLAILNARQREIQRNNYARHLDQIMPVMVEHSTPNSRGQLTGRSSQNKTVNFSCDALPPVGSYVDVRITAVFPSSLVGEAVSAPIAPSPALLAQQALNARVTVIA